MRGVVLLTVFETRFGSALCASSFRHSISWPLRAAMVRGGKAFVMRFGFMPLARRVLTSMSERCGSSSFSIVREHTSVSAVEPSLFTASRSAPWSMRYLAVSTWRLAQATMSGVARLFFVGRLISAPCLSKTAAQSVYPALTAAVRAESESGRSLTIDFWGSQRNSSLSISSAPARAASCRAHISPCPSFVPTTGIVRMEFALTTVATRSAPCSFALGTVNSMICRNK
mmetsp:Transcript_11658/g.38344  ORF Transcript_11658/g.38344 Transcript_11658/m.38344 type:complete len:228 (+) Transcript_11658:856-1539(+)